VVAKAADANRCARTLDYVARLGAARLLHDEARAPIAACHDVATLETRISRAATARTIADALL
jgi:hypothetical protein